MKFLYLSPTRFPTERAHGAQIAHMCHAFAQSDHDVTLLAPHRFRNPVAEDAYRYYALPKSFEIKYVFCMPWGVSSRLGFWSNLIVYTLRACFSLHKSRADIVYSRDEFVLFVASLIFPMKKILWESHEAKYNFASRSLLKRGVKCVAISEGIKEFYINHGVDAEQILVAHDGIDQSFFREVETKEQAQRRLGIDTDKPVAMYIGGLDEWKGVETFFAASKHNDNVRFVVIGGRVDEIERYRKKYPNVLFLGPRQYSELKHNQQAADVLVVPNTKKNELSEKYTSPLKLFTHLASKVPLIVSNISSLRSVVSENEVTFFTPDDPNDLAEKINQVLANMAVSRTKAEAAYALSKRYTWKRRAEYIVTFLRDAPE